MDKMNTVLLGYVSDVLNFWIYLVDVWGWLFSALMVVSLIAWVSLDEERKLSKSLCLVGFLVGSFFGMVGWFSLPYIAREFGFDLVMGSKWLQISGLILGVAFFLFYSRWVAAFINLLSHKITKRSQIERNRRTDIREISKYLPDESKSFDALKYLADSPIEKGVFIGLDEKGGKVFMPYDRWKKTHGQIVGTTGSGKGVVSTLMLAQGLRAGEAVFVLDPKNDEWAPSVLSSEAERAGVPFHYIDLNKPVLQLDLMAGITPYDLEELLISGFSLADKGGDADFYRASDRKAARIVSQNALDQGQTFTSLANDPFLMADEKEFKGFLGRLEELALLPSINALGGVNLAEVIEKGGCVYVVGSVRNSRVITAQRMIMARLLQLVEKRDRTAEYIRPVCVFLDELKYHISRPVLEGLGTARDKSMHLILAHQSIDDLRDCPADLDADSVIGAVVENCDYRVAYRLKNPSTAEWMAKMTGEIIVDDESRKIDRTLAGSETVSHERTIRQAVRYFVDVNMFLSLPNGFGVVMYGGTPKFAQICPIRAVKRSFEVKAGVSIPDLRNERETALVSRPRSNFDVGDLDVDI